MSWFLVIINGQEDECDGSYWQYWGNIMDSLIEFGMFFFFNPFRNQLLGRIWDFTLRS